MIGIRICYIGYIENRVLGYIYLVEGQGSGVTRVSGARWQDVGSVNQQLSIRADKQKLVPNYFS